MDNPVDTLHEATVVQVLNQIIQFQHKVSQDAHGHLTSPECTPDQVSYFLGSMTALDAVVEQLGTLLARTREA